MKQQKIKSVQEWLPFETILENGIIKLKNNSYIKIIKIIPINFNLKSELEKEAILNSYKIFLNINSQKKQENKKIKKIADDYIQYVKELNQNKKSSNKNFYMIIKNPMENEKIEEVIIEELNEKYYKIKECLARCGNVVKDMNEKEQVKKIILSFLDRRLYLL